MRVRSLGDAGTASLRARFHGGLSRADAQLLADHAESRAFVIDGVVSEVVRALLEGAGAAVARSNDETLVAASRAALLRARRRAHADDAGAIDAMLLVLERASEPPSSLRLRDRALDVRGEARVMGIVNVTPDSFYERVAGVDAALASARAIVADGGALVDVGGQSYAAGSARVDAAQERARVEPAVRAIAEAGLDVAISVDTVTASVADAALAAGAHLINDCSGLADPALADVTAKHGAGLIVMHLKGQLNVRDPQSYVYRDVLAEIVAFLFERTERAVAAGVARDAIAVDPGLEFGKEPATDLEILARFGELRALGYPIVLASSRKSFLGRLFGRPARDLLVPSLATAAAGIAAGARLLRVHDVAQTVELARVLGAIAGATRLPEERF